MNQIMLSGAQMDYLRYAGSEDVFLVLESLCSPICRIIFR
jgi:hypothetical protein